MVSVVPSDACNEGFNDPWLELCHIGHLQDVIEGVCDGGGGQPMRAPRARGQDGRQDEGQDPSTRRCKVKPQVVKAVFCAFCAFCVLCGRRGCSGGAGHEEIRVVLKETSARQDLLALAVAVCQARLHREATALSRPRVQLCKGQVASTCHRVRVPASMNRDLMLTIYS